MQAVDVPRLLAALEARNVKSEGLEIWASCPLGTHRDSDPSFQIHNEPGDENHGFWRCFGCHESGGPVGLVRKAKGYGSKQARAFLADIPSVEALGSSERAKTMSVVTSLRPLGARRFVEPEGVLRAPLEKWPGPLRDYAVGRGITAEQVERWRIGFVVSGRLAMRVYFPIDDELGRPGSYSARTVVGDRKRYLTPPKAEGPDPGAIFGRRHWPSEGERKLCVVVEGAINGLAVERATGLHVGALGGSNDAAAQWVHLATFERLILLSDPDKAGNKVAEAYALSGGPSVARALLPRGLDAQEAGPELVRKTIARVA